MVIEKCKKEEILCLLDRDGYIFPGFEIVKANNQPKLLGTGGFSSVYEMRCPERPESKYVLKVMGFENHIVTSENFRNTVNLQHFLSEQTPYICRVINEKEICIALDENCELTGVTDAEGERWEDDGIHLQFILMEQLTDIICKNRFGKIELLRKELENEDEVVTFALQVGQALHQAHIREILHRDVKLENVFWDEKSGCYKLGDFGIAKFAAGGNAETVVYTDGYGAPEIERHLYHCYNATADIYSFGITLYLLLNDFRFPGSEGYYVNAVQYNPEFVFPAPQHASEGMTRIIRKMCQYYQEDRYQSMAEVLMDLSAFRNRNKENTQAEDAGFPDFATETYKEEKISGDEQPRARRHELTGRARRKEEEKIDNKLYNEASVWYFVGFTLVLTLIMRGMQADTSVVYMWQFWILPFLLLIETILLRVKEFHFAFGAVTLGIGVWLGVAMGNSVPYAIMLMGLVTGIPVVTGSCVASTLIWALLMTTEKLQWLDFMGKHDLSWILIVIALSLLHHYILLRIDYDKTTYLRAQIDVFVFDKIYLIMMVVGIILVLLEKWSVIRVPELLQQLHLVRTGLVSFIIMLIYMSVNGYLDLGEEEQTDEDEMDPRGDGEHPDTIE